jgi:hypothetical protein
VDADPDTLVVSDGCHGDPSSGSGQGLIAPKLVQVLVSHLRKQPAGADVEIVTRGRG